MLPKDIALILERMQVGRGLVFPYSVTIIQIVRN